VKERVTAFEMDAFGEEGRFAQTDGDPKKRRERTRDIERGAIDEGHS